MPADRIFIVEDEVTIARGLEKKLRDFGYEVPGIATNAEMAITKIADTLPDLVLMDILLPGDMDGIDAARLIYQLSSIPIIFTSAHSDVEIMQRAKRSTPFGYLVKPIGGHTLRTTIEMALSRSSLERELKQTKIKLEASNLELTATFIELQKVRTQAEKTNKEKLALLAGISHEFFTPLNAILGFSQILERKEENLSPKQLEYLGEILAGGNTLLELVKRVVDVSETLDTLEPCKFTHFSISELVAEIASQYIERFSQKDIESHGVDIDDKPLIVNADRKYAAQILNLLFSIITEKSKEKDRISLLILPTDKCNLRVRIECTGMSISVLSQARRFESFNFQGEELPSLDNTGLRLSMSHSLAEAMGGKLEVLGDEVKGYKFYLDLTLVAE